MSVLQAFGAFVAAFTLYAILDDIIARRAGRK